MKTLKKVKEVKIRADKRSLQETNKELVRYVVEEVWNKRNFGILDNVVANDFIIHHRDPAREVQGREGARLYFASIAEAFPDIHFTIEDLIAEGDKVVTRWRASGTHLGPFRGIAPTGRNIEICATDIDTIEDGKITACWPRVDEADLMQQMAVPRTDNEPSGEEDGSLAWDDLAEGYDRYVTPTEDWVAGEALRIVGMKKGDTFLDVAAGCGGLSLPAARLGALVIATDWSSRMIELFTKNAGEEQLLNAEGRVMEGHDLDFGDNRFDFCGSQFGVMLFPEQEKALEEMTRVTKPGGKVFLISYGPHDNIEFLKFFIRSIQKVRPQFEGLPTDPLPVAFQICDPGVLEHRLRGAGLSKVRVVQCLERLTFRSGQELWDWIMFGNPIPGQIITSLDITGEEINIIQNELNSLLEKRANSHGTATLTNPINIGFGSK